MEDIWLERYAFKNKPFDHQRKYLERFWKKPVAALFADMGTGKSFMVINNIAMLYDVDKINAALIIALRACTGTGWIKNCPNICLIISFTARRFGHLTLVRPRR